MRTTLFMCAVAIASGCGKASDAPDVPVGSLSVAMGELAGDIPIAITLSDPAARLVNVQILQGVGAPEDSATPADGAIGLRGLETSVEGKQYNFVWSSTQDLGYVRSEVVHLALRLDAGPIGGIGDSIGPLTVDNTKLPRAYRVMGRICRASVIVYGSPAPGGDGVGKLFVGIFDDLGYPPSKNPVDSVDLGRQDLSSAGTCVTYAFPRRVRPGRYQLIATLDDNENNLVAGSGYLVDRGDLVNVELGTSPTGAIIDVNDADVTREVFLNSYAP